MHSNAIVNSILNEFKCDFILFILIRFFNKFLYNCNKNISNNLV